MSTDIIQHGDELAKRNYPDWEIRELHNVTTPGLNILARKGNARLGGSGFFYPVNTQGNHGYGHIRRGDAIPGGRQTKNRQAVIMPTILAGQVQLDGLTMAINSGDPYSFADIYDQNITSLLKEMMRFKNQVLFKDGSGVMATFVTPVDDSIGPHTFDDVTGIKEGQVYDVIDATATTRHVLDAKAVAVDWVNNTITFDKVIPAAVDANDRLFIADSQADSGIISAKDPVGLAGAIGSTGEYNGISRDGEANWRSTAYTASKYVDEDVLGRIRVRIHQDTGIGYQEMASDFAHVLHPLQLEVLFKMAIPRIRYTAGQGFELGHDGSFTFGGMKFVTDYHCPTTTMYTGDWSQFVTLYTPNGELHIDSEYNGAALKWVAGYDQGVVIVKSYYNFACLNPVRFAKTSSITAPSR